MFVILVLVTNVSVAYASSENIVETNHPVGSEVCIVSVKQRRLSAHLVFLTLSVQNRGYVLATNLFQVIMGDIPQLACTVQRNVWCMLAFVYRGASITSLFCGHGHANTRREILIVLA